MKFSISYCDTRFAQYLLQDNVGEIKLLCSYNDCERHNTYDTECNIDEGFKTYKEYEFACNV